MRRASAKADHQKGKVDRRSQERRGENRLGYDRQRREDRLEQECERDGKNAADDREKRGHCVIGKRLLLF
jgi:hypothetical protein